MKAVEALPAIVKEVPNVKMKFVGRFQPPGYEQELINKAAELGVTEALASLQAGCQGYLAKKK